MISQTAISFKINSDMLPVLDDMCKEYGVKRNAMLNLLCQIGINNLKGNRARFNLISVYSQCDL